MPNSLRSRLLHEAAQRGRLAVVLPLLVAADPPEHVSISALQRLLRLCGVSVSEKYLGGILTARYAAARGRFVTDRLTKRRAVVWYGIRLRGGGLARAKAALLAEYEAALADEGMTPELPAEPAWRTMSMETVDRLSSGRGPRVLVRLPSDDPGHRAAGANGGPPGTVESRARNFLADALAAGPYHAALSELLWRGTDWSKYPAWHRTLLEEHLETGLGYRAFCRKHPVSERAAKAALQLHRTRAGLRPGE